MRLLTTIVFITSYTIVYAQPANWPKTIEHEKAKIVIYQPQPETFEGNILTGRSAIAVTPVKQKDPVFGAIWFSANVETDKVNRIVTLKSLQIPEIKFPGETDEAAINDLKNVVIEDAKNWALEISLDQLLTTLDLVEKEQMIASDLNNNPPTIIFTKKPSVLVYFDGDPIMQKIEDSDIKRAVNTPFLIMQNPDDKKFYLSGGDLWFMSADPLAGWENTSNVPKNIQKEAKKLIGNDTISVTAQSTIPEIITATEPTELIQTNGEPNYLNIAGTNLLYIENSDNHLFLNINTQIHYLLISGRWFTSKTLEGPWTFMEASELPSDFAKIPEGSAKDVVLASVPGTKASKEAVLEAQIPQTATVDRKTATTNVEYDGTPKFEKIDGTSMEYAVNTSSTVIKSNNTYYVVDNGVWFESSSPNGPWVVSTERPDEIDQVSPSSPVYNTKYVYIYDSTPDVVYVGYTSGYTNSYIYGSTVVYGTGYYYQPWYGYYYYPHPMTYGYNMYYNPYAGWSFGFHFSYNYYYPNYYHHHPHYGGWYGPPYYHPYHPPYYNNNGGYYGPNKGGSSNTGGGGSRDYQPEATQGNKSGNLYNNHNKGVSTPDRSKPNTAVSGETPANKKPNTSTNNKANTKNNMYTDKQGNVYKDNNNKWETQNPQNNKWENPNKNTANKNTYQQNKSTLDQSKSDRNRGYQNYNNASKASTNSYRPSGGGGMKGGGGGKRH